MVYPWVRRCILSLFIGMECLSVVVVDFYIVWVYNETKATFPKYNKSILVRTRNIIKLASLGPNHIARYQVRMISNILRVVWLLLWNTCTIHYCNRFLLCVNLLCMIKFYNFLIVFCFKNTWWKCVNLLLICIIYIWNCLKCVPFPFMNVDQYIFF